MSEYPIWIGDQVLAALLTFCEEEEPPVALRGPYQPRRKTVLDEILEYVRAHPDMTTHALAAALNQKPRTMLTYLDRLVQLGKVRKLSGKPNLWWAA